MSAASESDGTDREPGTGMFGAGFDALRPGDGYQSSPGLIDQRAVDMFAALTGDRHPLHVDPEWAVDGPFGGAVAHGLLVLSCAVGSLPLDPDRVLALRRLRDAVFKRPLRVGESIVVHCRVLSLRPLDEGTGLVECEWRILGGDGKLRVRASAEILWRRDPAATREGPTAAALANFQPPVVEPADDADEPAPVEVTDDGLRALI